MATAACANSRVRSERIWASTTRATSIQEVIAIRMTIEGTDGEISAEIASSRKIEGKHSIASTKRISAAPITPS